MHAVTSVVTSALVAMLALSPSARSQKPIEVFDAQAVNLDAPAGAVAGPVQIRITRWSTDAERDQVNNAIKERGADKLLDVIKDFEPVGENHDAWQHRVRPALRAPRDRRRQRAGHCRGGSSDGIYRTRHEGALD